MHDAFWLKFAAEYALLSMTVMVRSCLWYVVGKKLAMSYVKFPQAPFARVPFGECREYPAQIGQFGPPSWDFEEKPTRPPSRRLGLPFPSPH